MAWTAPMTAVSGNAFTAAQFNTNIRDNLLETAPAKATTIGSLFVCNGANSIVERMPPSSDSITTAETTASTVYADLATVGPVVTVTTGAKALVMQSAWMHHTTTSNVATYASVAVSGATTTGANDSWAVTLDGVTFNNAVRMGAAHLFTALTPGSNTFTMKYKVETATTGSFQRRELIVIPL